MTRIQNYPLGQYIPIPKWFYQASLVIVSMGYIYVIVDGFQTTRSVSLASQTHYVKLMHISMSFNP